MISAIVLAAGKSMRMGKSKMLLPWGQTTVIGKIIATLLEAGLVDLHVVTGGNQDELKEALSQYRVNFVINPDYSNGEMLSSVKVGLRNMPEKSEASLIVLGDQPQIEVKVVQLIMERYFSTRNKIIVPSFQMHRGHPWLINNSLWRDILDLARNSTLRDYLNLNQDNIFYINVNTPSIIQDLDTPEDYYAFKP